MSKRDDWVIPCDGGPVKQLYLPPARPDTPKRDALPVRVAFPGLGTYVRHYSPTSGNYLYRWTHA